MYLGLDKGKNGGLSELRLSLAPFPLFVCSGKRNSYAWPGLASLGEIDALGNFARFLSWFVILCLRQRHLRDDWNEASNLTFTRIEL